MDKKIREHISELLKAGEDIPAEYEEDLFPTTKKEYELVYAGKERKEKILSDTMSVPFQAIKHFGGKSKESDGWINQLIFGDNLQALKHLLKLKQEGKLKNADGTDGVRLIYIDPPFATKQDFQGNSGAKAYQDKIVGAQFLEFIRKRLILLKELLSEDGSIFVHLDWKKSHYIKTILDEIFSENNLRNEIIWAYTGPGSPGMRQFNRKHDTIFWYSKGKSWIFNNNNIREPLSGNLGGGWEGLDEEARKEHAERGKVPEDWWEIAILARLRVDGINRAGYPTEKPEKLLNRIVQTASNEGDIVLDCFAGSGMTGFVAEKAKRRWIMCDCGKLSIYTIQRRIINIDKSKYYKREGLEYISTPYNKKNVPFVLYNAGLYYDGKLLEHMQREEYKEFVLELFGCQKRDHEINGLDFQGTLNNHSVMVFDKEHYLTHEFIDQLDKTIGKSIKSECFIIAPAGIVGFGEDYIKKSDRRYTVLRIPNSIIAYIRDKNFTKLEQPRTSEDVNQTIDAVGFDFIYPPKVKSKYSFSKPKGKLSEVEYSIEIEKFEPVQLGSKIVEFTDPKAESLAMVLIDLDYDGDTFQMDKYWFGSDITKNNFKISFDDKIGEKVMVIYLDIFGNEKKEILNKNDFDMV